MLRSAAGSTKPARCSTGRPSAASRVESVHNMSVHSPAFAVDSFVIGLDDGFEVAFVISDDDNLTGFGGVPNLGQHHSNGWPVRIYDEETGGAQNRHRSGRPLSEEGRLPGSNWVRQEILPSGLSSVSRKNPSLPPSCLMCPVWVSSVNEPSLMTCGFSYVITIFSPRILPKKLSAVFRSVYR